MFTPRAIGVAVMGGELPGCTADWSIAACGSPPTRDRAGDRARRELASLETMIERHLEEPARILELLRMLELLARERDEGAAGEGSRRACRGGNEPLLGTELIEQRRIDGAAAGCARHTRGTRDAPCARLEIEPIADLLEQTLLEEPQWTLHLVRARGGGRGERLERVPVRLV